MHSTETAVLKVLADILLALDSGDLAMLTLLDLSAAFDSHHDTLLERLQKSYGLSGQVLNLGLPDFLQQNTGDFCISVTFVKDNICVSYYTMH